MFNNPMYGYYRYSPPEVVQIPIHFMSSVRPKIPLPESEESAALKIQRVFRGFLVRKSVKKLSAIGNEVREVESSINDTETVELIRLDAKERLRVNERIMLLLLKLDSIRGVYYGVRDLRKAVTRKAIVLQEKIDSIVDTTIRSDEIVSEIEIVREINSEQVTDSSATIRSDETGSAIDIAREINSEQVTVSSSIVAVMNTISSDVTGSETEIEIAQVTDSSPFGDQIVDDSRRISDKFEIACEINSKQVTETSPFRDQIVDDSTNLSGGTESVMNATLEAVKEINVNFEPVEGAAMEVVKEIAVNCDSVEGEGTDDDDDNKKKSMQLLEKLMDDNEEMMKLMSQMFERNEMQTRMINSLSRRVEQLEKTFGCDKPRKKKKKLHSV